MCDVQIKSDLWSLGVIIYEMIMSVRPFSNTTLEELTTFLNRDEYKPPMPTSRIVSNLGFVSVLRERESHRPEGRNGFALPTPSTRILQRMEFSTALPVREYGTPASFAAAIAASPGTYVRYDWPAAPQPLSTTMEVDHVWTTVPDSVMALSWILVPSVDVIVNWTGGAKEILPTR